MRRTRIRTGLLLALLLVGSALAGCIGWGSQRRLDRERGTQGPLRGERGYQQPGNKAGASWGIRF
jgi:hypothetical protein